MAIIIPVATPLSPAVNTALESNVTAAHTVIDPLVIPLSEAQSKAMTPVSTNREAEISAIQTGLMNAFPSTQSANCTLDQFKAMVQEEKDTAIQHANYTVLAGELESHLKIVKNNLYVYAIETLDNATLLSKNNPTMAAEVKLIKDKFNSRTKATDEVDFSIAMAGSVSVSGVKKDKVLTNTGNTVITVLKVNGNLVDTLTINPSGGKAMPKGWTNVVVTNSSATEVGAFKVHLKV